MYLDIVSNISKIDPKAWDDINVEKHPFTSFSFLSSLEESNSVSAKTGWQPQHIILKNTKNKIIGILPNYLKNHSYGEYVFDHSWANAYEGAGGSYYPKLISSIPFTPVNGPRFLYKKNEKELVIKKINEFLQKITISNNLSSAHINFFSKDSEGILEKNGWLKRTGLQYHWENCNYTNFNDFLKSLRRTKRKMIKKEREFINNTGIRIIRITGDDLKVNIWDKFYKFYINTINKKWGSAYLTREFFDLISNQISNNILLILAKKNDDIIAGALNFIGNDCLYGRNWGCEVEIPFLHFEMCYYQAIEYAIDYKLKYVEAGAQGNHKIKRGYLAKPTYSYHYLPNKFFKKAVHNFIKKEEIQIKYHIENVNNEGSPYNLL